MRAGVITGQGQFELIDVPEPTPTDGSVVVEIRACGICGSDVHAYTEGWRYAPQLCGHEWFGSVVAVGPEAAGVREGDLVMAGISTGCGVCSYCRAGHSQYCSTAQRSYSGFSDANAPSGGFAPLIGIEARRLVNLPPDLSDAQGALVEPSAVAFHAVRQSRMRPGDTVAVVGAGAIGQLTAQCARLAGASQVIVVEPDTGRRDLAASLGADVTLNADDDTRGAVRELTGGLGVDVAFDAAGVPQTLEVSVGLVRRGGSVCLVGVSGAPTTVMTNRWMTKEINLFTSLVFTLEEATAVGVMIGAGRLGVESLHQATVGLDELPATIVQLANRELDAVKVLVDPTRAG